MTVRKCNRFLASDLADVGADELPPLVGAVAQDVILQLNRMDPKTSTHRRANELVKRFVLFLGRVFARDRGAATVGCDIIRTGGGCASTFLSLAFYDLRDEPEVRAILDFATDVSSMSGLYNDDDRMAMCAIQQAERERLTREAAYPN